MSSGSREQGQRVRCDASTISMVPCKFLLKLRILIHIFSSGSERLLRGTRGISGSYVEPAQVEKQCSKIKLLFRLRSSKHLLTAKHCQRSSAVGAVHKALRRVSWCRIFRQHLVGREVDDTLRCFASLLWKDTGFGAR